MKKSIANEGGDDTIQTPRELAQAIINHFFPVGKCCDPCAGIERKPFYDALCARPGMTEEVDWYEIEAGRDFLDCKKPRHYDWIVTNPPWGNRFNDILVHSMNCSDNVVFLMPINAWMTKKRMYLINSSGFGIYQIAMCRTPESPWPQSGFQLAATHLKKRSFFGNVHLSEIKW